MRRITSNCINCKGISNICIFHILYFAKYQFSITDDWNVRPSISVGYGSKNFGFQNLVLEDQINIFSGIINANSIDPISLNESVRFIDFSTSVLFNSENPLLFVPNTWWQKNYSNLVDKC